MRTTNKNLDHPLVMGRCPENDGYTLFKNTNEELVEKIKSLNKKSETWKQYGYKGQCKIVQKLNDTQRLCVDEALKYFIKNVDEFEETNNNNLLDEINNKFDVSEAIESSLGPLYTSDGYKRVSFVSYKKELKQYEKEENYSFLLEHYSGYGSMGRVFYKEIGVELNLYDGITLKEGEIDGNALFCHFNKDGNICNRDYNYDIKECLGNKPKTREDLIKEIVSNIPDVAYKHYGNKWFAVDFAFVLEKTDSAPDEDGISQILNLRKLEHNSKDSYGDSHSGRIKMPKDTVEVRKEHILQHILPLVNKINFGNEVDLSKYIDVKKSETTSKPAKKRIQKTKLNEKKFSEVLDWRKEEFVLEEKDLMQALSNLENGIEIGESEDTIKDIAIDLLGEGDLPSFSFNKGEKQPNHDKYKALLKLPHNCNFTFSVAEGEAVEISWAHSIYATDVVEFELVS